MDKYEFNIKVEQIKKMVNKEDFATAMKIADTIDWRRVRNANLLSTISQVYEKNEEYQEAKEVLLLAFERAPIGKRFLYKLTELALNEGSVREAEDYYREFCELAPDDTRQYILRYLILKGKNASIDQLIQAMERYINTELDEKWMYELAELYAKAGRGDACVQLCDKMILMFGIGTYVEKATELKKRYAPLNSQQRKPDGIQNYSSNNGKIMQMPGNPGYNGNWQNSGNNYGAGMEGYGTDNNYGTGYDPESGYVAGTGYGQESGYGAEQGYGPAGGYGAGEGYAPQGGYGAETGYGAEGNYGAEAGYGLQNNYETGAEYGSQNSYGTGYNAGNVYGTGAGYGPGNNYVAESGYGVENSYGVGTGYGTENEYQVNVNYDPGNDYGAETDFNTGNGYAAESEYSTGNVYGMKSGYNAGNVYGTKSDYNAGNVYGVESGYDASNGYGAGAGYDAQNGYGAGPDYDTKNNYGTGPNYGSEKNYGMPAADDNGYSANTAYDMNSQGYPPYNGMNNYGNTGNYGTQEQYEANPPYQAGNVYGANEKNVYENDVTYDGGYEAGADYSGGRDYRDDTVYETDNGYGRDETYETGSSYDSGAWPGAEEKIPQQRPAGYGTREYGYAHPHGGYPPVGPYVVDEELMANLHQAAAEKELAAEMSRISTEEYVEPEPISNQTRVFRGKNNIRILRPRMEEEEKPFYHRSYTPHHMIIEARSAQEGVKTAVEELKKVHQETGVNNSVIKITGSKLSKRGVINVSDKLAGKDLIVEEAGDLTQKDLEELQMLLERDETGMIVVLIDNPLQIEELHQQNPGFINLFKCIDSEKDVQEQVQAAQLEEEWMQEKPHYQKEPESCEPQQSEPEPELGAEQASQPEPEPEPVPISEPEPDSEEKLDGEPEEEADAKEEPESEVQPEREEFQEPTNTEEPERKMDASDEEIDDEGEKAEEPFEPDKESDDWDEYKEEGYPEEEYLEEEYPEEEYLEEEYPDDEPEEERYDEVYDDEGEYGDEEYEDSDAVDEDEELGIEAFTDYAVQYASEIDCSITGKSLLALCQHVETMEENGIPLTRANAEDMIEEAADKAEKPSIGGLIKGVFSSKYDKEGLLILKEEHFL